MRALTAAAAIVTAITMTATAAIAHIHPVAVVFSSTWSVPPSPVPVAFQHRRGRPGV